MCAVSFLGDGYAETFPKRWPQIPIAPTAPIRTDDETREVSKEDLDALRKEVEELKKLLLAAKAYDEATGQADCEMEEKVALIRQIAEMVGVNVDEVFGG